MNSYIFPLAFMANAFAMTGLLIFLGISSRSVLAADVAIVQAASLALLQSFSANARNLILNGTAGVSPFTVLMIRAILLFPLAILTYWLCTGVSGVNGPIAVLLILRRISEWAAEVHLSELELNDHFQSAKAFVVMQSLLLAFVAVGITFNLTHIENLLFLWGAIPLIFSSGFFLRLLKNIRSAFAGFSRSLLPHMGSSIVIGITVYVFRIFLVLLVDKEKAGDLFAAFAIGGLPGTIIAQGLGPTIVFHEERKNSNNYAFIIKAATYISVSLGLVISGSAAILPESSIFLGKSRLFWLAFGLSLIGGAIMMHAQMIRHRFLQKFKDKDVFGSDVLMNTLIIAIIPVLKILFGTSALSALFLLSAMLAYFFYRFNRSVEWNAHSRGTIGHNFWILTITALITLPVFFQLSSGLFSDKALIFDSHGEVLKVPLPLSLLGCLILIIISGNFHHARKGFIFLFFSFFLMVLGTVVTTNQSTALEKVKLVLIIQFLLPIFGLVAGQLYLFIDFRGKLKFRNIAFLFATLLVAVQIALSLARGYFILTPDMIFFSIYQNLEYVPGVFTAIFLLALPRLSLKLKSGAAVSGLCLLYASYALLSQSSAINFLLTGMIFLSGHDLFYQKSRRLLSATLAIIILTAGVGFFSDSIKNSPAYDKTRKALASIENLLPEENKKLASREYYLRGVTASPATLFLGNPQRPDRNMIPSSYNYYLDLLYNFGLLAVIPLLLLLSHTIAGVFRWRAAFMRKSESFALVFVVFYLLLVVNFQSVGMRQPYSGIITFFLWGALLSQIEHHRIELLS